MTALGKWRNLSTWIETRGLNDNAKLTAAIVEELGLRRKTNHKYCESCYVRFASLSNSQSNLSDTRTSAFCCAAEVAQRTAQKYFMSLNVQCRKEVLKLAGAYTYHAGLAAWPISPHIGVAPRMSMAGAPLRSNGKLLPPCTWKCLVKLLFLACTSRISMHVYLQVEAAQNACVVPVCARA